MKRTIRYLRALAIIALATASVGSGHSHLFAQDLEVVSTSPTPNGIGLHAHCFNGIEIVFSEAIDPGTVDINSIVLHSAFGGRWNGFCWTDGETVLYQGSECPFLPGDLLSVTVTTDVVALSGATLAQPYVWTFMGEAAEAPGTFEFGGCYQVGHAVIDICAVRLNSDYWIDLAVIGSDSVFIYLNDGSGGLLEGQRIGNLMDAPEDLEACDTDSDGDVDLIAFCPDYEIWHLVNDGTGNFTPVVVLSNEHKKYGGCVADVNGDGHMDIVMSQYAANIVVLLNDGLGQFPTVSEFEFDTYNFYGQYDNCTLLDFDLNGNMDLLVWKDAIALHPNDGSGGFTDAVLSPLPGLSCGLGSGVGDLNGDGYPDAAIGHHYPAEVWVMLNDGSNGFDLSESRYLRPEIMYHADVADFTGDGQLDIGAVVPVDSLGVLVGNGDGHFQDVSFYYSGDYTWQCSYADIDGDGDIDAVLGNQVSEDLYVLINRYCSDYDGDGYGDPYHPENECPEDNCPLIYNPDQIDDNENGLGDACEFEETLEGGSPQWVFFEGSGVGVDFPFVFGQGGDITLDVLTCGLGDHPVGFQVAGVNMPLCYDINIDFYFQTPAVVCIDYDDTGMTEFEEEALVMQHWFLGDWAPMPTVWLDTEYNTICAETNTFSIFAVTFPLPYVCGDADASGDVDIDDVVYLINFIFAGGPEPAPYESGDADCSEAVDIDDAVFLISFIFSGGNTPCDTDGDYVPDC